MSTSTAHLYPWKLKPVYKDYLWGGRKIGKVYHRSVPRGPCAESWEVSTRPEGMSEIENGPMVGRTLQEAIAFDPVGVLGAVGGGRAHFPLLVKLIDANDKLSVQVHPDDESAARCGGEAKTEAWHVLQADKGAGLYAGLKPGTTAEQVRRASQDGTIGDRLLRFPAKPGDTFFMPGGRVHALDAGCLILEVQQNSNTTYRLYDWGRVGADGQPRETHLEQALEVMRFDDAESPLVPPGPGKQEGGADQRTLVQCPYFQLDDIRLSGPFDVQPDGGSFHVLFVADGDVVCESCPGYERWETGASLFIPASPDAGFAVRPRRREARLLRIRVP